MRQHVISVSKMSFKLQIMSHTIEYIKPSNAYRILAVP